MAIRLRTLRRMKDRYRSVYRVRRRGYDTPKVWDTDGEVSRPDTWSRWEEEYFSVYGYAVKASWPEGDSGDWKRSGYIDQVPAARVLALLGRGGFEMEEFENGILRVVYPQMVSNARIVGC